MGLSQRTYRSQGNIEPLAPVIAADEDDPAEHPIYFVAILKNVPTDSTIEVRWYKDSDTRPQVVRDVQGSDKYEIISSFSPPGGEFVPGTYSVRVYVRDEEIGAKSFTILGDDPFAGGVKIKGLKLSTKVRSGMRPKRPAKQFRKGTRKEPSYGENMPPRQGPVNPNDPGTPSRPLSDVKMKMVFSLSPSSSIVSRSSPT